MSTKQSPIVKNWLKIGSIAFGVSCGCTLPFTQNLAQSALIGVATIPGMAASVVVRSRQRQQQVQCQIERGRLRLRELQHRGAILNEQLQLRDKDRQEIELRVSQLHSLAANLTARLDRDRDRHQQLEHQLSALTIYDREQQNLAANLDRKIQDKQACLLEVDTDVNRLKVELDRVRVDRVQLEAAKDLAQIKLTDIQLQLDRCLAMKQELELQIQQVQSQKVVQDGDFDESISQKQLLLEKLDLAISDRQKTQQETIVELDRLNSIIAEKIPELASQEQKLIETRSQLSAVEFALQGKQAELDELAAQIPNETDPLSDRLLQRELRIAQLELSSRQAELDNLELKIHSKLRSTGEIDLEVSSQTFEPQPPQIFGVASLLRQTFHVGEALPLALRNENRNVAGTWYDRFIDNPHLTILKHIEKHGTITEAEASSKLGNARSVRQFANKLEEYAQNLPFSIRVESSPKGNRYLKEDRN